jgi:hypothetical protein
MPQTKIVRREEQPVLFSHDVVEKVYQSDTRQQEFRREEVIMIFREAINGTV